MLDRTAGGIGNLQRCAQQSGAQVVALPLRRAPSHTAVGAVCVMCVLRVRVRTSSGARAIGACVRRGRGEGEKAMRKVTRLM